MKNINILDSNTIDKIAAGEVVERPSAVVKELLENSVDANAKNITIEIKDGGISFIRITDNGEGIDKTQIKKAFMRHATSKIKGIEDLVNVSSLGFRGEALSSIASVAKVEMLTKVKDDFIGTRYVVEGGNECVFEDAGVPDGTTIIVRDLFYNIPARRKFLKSAQTEGNYISELLEHMIISHPNIAFKYIYNGNVKLQSSGSGDIKNAIYSVYGRDITNNLIEVSSSRDDISISGFIGKPELARSTRNYSIYFVNGRYIRSSLIDRALDEAYKTYLMLHKYPTVFLYFDIPGYLLDVNVHPAKREIRFIEGESLKNYIVCVVLEALKSKELIPDIHTQIDNIKPNIQNEKIIPEPFEINRLSSISEEKIQHSIYEDIEEETETKSSATSNLSDFFMQETPLETQNEFSAERKEATEKAHSIPYEDLLNKSEVNKHVSESNVQLSLFEDRFISEEATAKHKLIGQLFDTYWLIEYENKLFIMDQHAAHEKVNYERLIKRLRNNEKTSQNIYPPIVITLSNSEADYVEKYNENFLDIGFTIEHFGGHEYTISTVPLELLSQNPKDYFHDMLDDLINGKMSKETDVVNLKIATMACKSAVKGNMKLSFMEADALISELLTLENPYNCPHGRPTIVSYSKYEIEKMFKRVVN